MTQAHHARSDWTKTPAADSHLWPDPTQIKGVAVHYNGPPVPQSALTDPRSYLEGVRRFHTTSKGWSDIAYNLAVDQNGDLWDLRGLDHMSGANGDTLVNEQWVAILGIVGQGQAPTEAMLDGLRSAIALVRHKFPFAMKIKGHQDVRPSVNGQPSTECPGPDLELAVNTGRLIPNRKHSQENTVTPQDIDNIAEAVTNSLLTKHAVAFRNQVRKAVDAELTQRADDAAAPAQG